MDTARTKYSNELRSFGRRRGRKLSAHQEDLLEAVFPKIRLDLARPAADQLRLIGGEKPREVWLEIGFGGGEHLIWQAARNPDVLIIGCEPYLEGVVKVTSAIDREGLANVRLHDDDARDVLRWLPSETLARAFILFPDPWPKKRHHKRRLVNRDTLAALARAMRRGGELRLATDIADYVRFMLIEAQTVADLQWLADRADDWRRRTDDWPATRYEEKAERSGRVCYYFRFARV
jgi:tRNA (guanine-N7-)-methyltransferase